MSWFQRWWTRRHGPCICGSAEHHIHYGDPRHRGGLLGPNSGIRTREEADAVIERFVGPRPRRAP